MAGEQLVPVRKIPLGRRALTGSQPVAGGRSVGFESSLERDFIALMLLDPATLQIEEQPVRIPLAGGRRYTPDFLVTRRDLPPLLVEVKPQVEVDAAGKRLADRFAVAEAFASARGWQFEVWTERRIRVPRLENARFLLPFRQRHVDAGSAARLLRSASAASDLTVDDLTRTAFTTETDRMRAVAALWHLIAIGRLVVDLDVPVTPASPVRLPEEPR